MPHSPLRPSSRTAPMSNLVTYHHPSGLFSISYPSNDSIIQTQYPSFFPPIGSDNLFDSLRTVYSHCSDHASRIHAARTQAESWLQSITRMRLPSDGIHTPGSPDANADVQSFVTESTVETVPSLPLGPAHHGGGSSTVATSISMPSCSTGGSETGRVSAGARSQKSRSPPTQADMTFQWKLESHAPPGPGHGANSSSVALADGPTHSPLIESMARKANRAHFKRTLTEDEKVEFKRRRRIGACIDCRKKKKKCTHDPGSDLFDRQILAESRANNSIFAAATSPHSSSTGKSGSADLPPGFASGGGDGGGGGGADPMDGEEFTDDTTIPIEFLNQFDQDTIRYMAASDGVDWDTMNDHSAWDIDVSRPSNQDLDTLDFAGLSSFPVSGAESVQDKTILSTTSTSTSTIKASAVTAAADLSSDPTDGLVHANHEQAVVSEAVSVPMATSALSIGPKTVPAPLEMDQSTFDPDQFSFFSADDLALANFAAQQGVSMSENDASFGAIMPDSICSIGGASISIDQEQCRLLVENARAGSNMDLSLARPEVPVIPSHVPAAPVVAMAGAPMVSAPALTSGSTMESLAKPPSMSFQNVYVDESSFVSVDSVEPGSATATLKRKTRARALSARSANAPVSAVPPPAPPIPDRSFADPSFGTARPPEYGTAPNVPISAPSADLGFDSRLPAVYTAPRAASGLARFAPPAMMAGTSTQVSMSTLSRAATVASTGRYGVPGSSVGGVAQPRSRVVQPVSSTSSLGLSGNIATAPVSPYAATAPRRSQIPPSPRYATLPRQSVEMSHSRTSSLGGVPMGDSSGLPLRDGVASFSPPGSAAGSAPVGRAMRMSISRAPEKPRMLSVSSSTTPTASPRDLHHSLWRNSAHQTVAGASSSFSRPLSVPIAAAADSPALTATSMPRFDASMPETSAPFVPTSGPVPTQVSTQAPAQVEVSDSMPPPPMSFSATRFRRAVRTTRNQIYEATSQPDQWDRRDIDGPIWDLEPHPEVQPAATCRGVVDKGTKPKSANRGVSIMSRLQRAFGSLGLGDTSSSSSPSPGRKHAGLVKSKNREGGEDAPAPVEVAVPRSAGRMSFSPRISQPVGTPGGGGGHAGLVISSPISDSGYSRADGLAASTTPRTPSRDWFRPVESEAAAGQDKRDPVPPTPPAKDPLKTAMVAAATTTPAKTPAKTKPTTSKPASKATSKATTPTTPGSGDRPGGRFDRDKPEGETEKRSWTRSQSQPQTRSRAASRSAGVSGGAVTGGSTSTAVVSSNTLPRKLGLAAVPVQGPNPLASASVSASAPAPPTTTTTTTTTTGLLGDKSGIGADLMQNVAARLSRLSLKNRGNRTRKPVRSRAE